MKTFITGMTIITLAAIPLSGASILAAQMLLWVGGLGLAAVAFH